MKSVYYYLSVLIIFLSACHTNKSELETIKVAQLAHAGGGGALDDDVEQVLHEADDHAVHRAEGEGTQQGGQVGEVHLDEGRDEHRDGELDEHQDKGHRAAPDSYTHLMLQTTERV